MEGSLEGKSALIQVAPKKMGEMYSVGQRRHIEPIILRVNPKDSLLPVIDTLFNGDPDRSPKFKGLTGRGRNTREYFLNLLVSSTEFFESSRAPDESPRWASPLEFFSLPKLDFHVGTNGETFRFRMISPSLDDEGRVSYESINLIGSYLNYVGESGTPIDQNSNGMEFPHKVEYLALTHLGTPDAPFTYRTETDLIAEEESHIKRRIADKIRGHLQNYPESLLSQLSLEESVVLAAIGVKGNEAKDGGVSLEECDCHGNGIKSYVHELLSLTRSHGEADYFVENDLEKLTRGLVMKGVIRSERCEGAQRYFPRDFGETEFNPYGERFVESPR